MKNNKIEMYLDSKTVKKFADNERNDTEEHSVISKIIDDFVSDQMKDSDAKIANLGAGANPQKYPKILGKISEGSTMDWVDISPKMLEIASKDFSVVPSGNSIKYIKSNFTDYISSKKDEELDCVIMQYCINYVENLEIFFSLLSKKLKKDGTLIANLGGNKLENNQWVTFLVNGKELSGATQLVSGDIYTINFLNPNGTIFASTEKNYFSDKEIMSAASLFGLKAKINMVKGFKILILKK